MTFSSKISAPAFLENAFKTGYGRKALLSYITRPLIFDNLPPSHGNITICRELSRAIGAAGYDLDVVRFTSTDNIDYSVYEMLIGFGHAYENSFYTNYTGKRIYLATGAYTCQRNAAELLRILALKKRCGIQAIPQRLKNYPDYASSVLSDAIICTGNEWTLNTYRAVFTGKLFRTPVIASSFFDKDDFYRDWGKVKMSFLWFGGEGCILKGLDLCIEAFLELPDLELHICGPANCEALRIYDKEIRRASNITYHGFVDVSSMAYKDILGKCGFVIYPSASEAGAGSVIDTMMTGLIPIVTEEASVDIGEFGFMLDNTDIEYIKKVIEMASKQSQDGLERRSQLCYEATKATFSGIEFRRGVENALQYVLSV